MAASTAEVARDLILDHVGEQLAAKGLTPSDVPPSFDLLLEGVIDSFGVVELVLMLEQRFGFEFDFDELDADDLTRIGPLTDHVERKAGLA
jgi:acyl carrier protein